MDSHLCGLQSFRIPPFDALHGGARPENSFRFYFWVADRRRRVDRTTLLAFGKPVSPGGGSELDGGRWTNSTTAPGAPSPPPIPARTPNFAHESIRGRAFLPASIRRPAKRESPFVTSTASPQQLFKKELYVVGHFASFKSLWTLNNETESVRKYTTQRSLEPKPLRFRGIFGSVPRGYAFRLSLISPPYPGLGRVAIGGNPRKRPPWRLNNT